MACKSAAAKTPQTPLKAESFEELMEYCEGIKALVGWAKDDEVVFRGHESSDWPLEPSLFRFVRAKRGAVRRSDVQSFESLIYYLFAARMASKLGADQSGWDYLFHMQHYAVPTRLLDWSESPGKALWFACGAQDSKRDSAAAGKAHLPCLWVLNASALNKTSWGFDESIDPNYLCGDSKRSYRDIVANYNAYEFDEPVAVYPNYLNERMRAQSGLFTTFGNNLGPLEAQVPKAVAKIVLGEKCTAQARRMGRFYALNDYEMFPDVQGLANFIRNEF